MCAGERPGSGRGAGDRAVESEAGARGQEAGSEVAGGGQGAGGGRRSGPCPVPLKHVPSTSGGSILCPHPHARGPCTLTVGRSSWPSGMAAPPVLI